MCLGCNFFLEKWNSKNSNGRVLFLGFCYVYCLDDSMVVEDFGVMLLLGNGDIRVFVLGRSWEVEKFINLVTRIVVLSLICLILSFLLGFIVI